MSTKTTFKRIALVAVAALGFGTLSVAPSSADYLEGSFGRVSFATSPATATTAVETSAIISLGGSCANAAGNNIQQTYYLTIASAPAGTNLLANSVFTVPTGGNDYDTTVPTGYTQVNGTAYTISSQNFAAGQDYAARVMGECTDASSAMTVYSKVRFTPDVVGTYVIAAIPADNSATRPTATWTVVASAPVLKSSTAFVNTTLGSVSTADATAANLTFSAAASTTAKARLDVKQYSTTDTTTAAVAAITKDVVVAISKGLVSKTNDYSAGAASVTEAGGVSGAISSDYYVFANGTVGAASLTVTVDGVLVSTKAIVFNGVATTLAAALTTGQKTWIAPTQTTTLTVSSKDAAGSASSNTPTITATSSNTAVATVVATSNTLVTITGVAAGTAVITVADSATTSPAASATYTVTVKAATTTAAATMTFDKTDYAPGELMTITIAADVADNASYAAFTANPVVSVNVVTVLNPFTTGAVALVGGKATWTAYAPATGNVTVTATSSAGPTTAVAVTASANVTNAAFDQAQAATDAAAEATDAANAATDAANAAAEAADAATAAAQDAADAVAALSTSVAAMIDALKKQITALTNLVIKIQKKVKA